MAKSSPDWVKDAKLEAIADNCDKLVLCEGEPSTYSHVSNNKGVSDGKRLGTVDLTTGAGGGDYTIADNDGGGGGRMLTIGAQTGLTVDVNGDWDHVALVDSVNSRLGPVTTKTSQAITTAGTVDVAAFAIRDKDPT
ncbi:hypothetical protein [Oceanibacterium hippocampi]|uniref:Uncharacterized protein n=1 Tax=Oceanibacterium hippocampi TaxID=745714 RepID=A0A1Y5SWV0_9PROT|nr:hypothetical protein [Oceanibacterium hippocampi]SLN50333.1 hypothetical protein OCH7691_02217 [Oceanibacterium hippocampi]